MDNLIFEVGSAKDVLTGKRAVILIVPFSNYNDQCKNIVDKFITDDSILTNLVKDVLIPNDIFTFYICLINVDVDYSNNSRRLITTDIYNRTNVIINKIGYNIGDAYRNANYIPVISGKYFLTMKSISKMVTSNSIFTVPRRKAIKLNTTNNMVDKEIIDKCREYMKSVVCIALSDYNFYKDGDRRVESIIEKTLIDAAFASFIPITNTGIITPP